MDTEIYNLDPDRPYATITIDQKEFPRIQSITLSAKEFDQYNREGGNRGLSIIEWWKENGCFVGKIKYNEDGESNPISEKNVNLGFVKGIKKSKIGGG